MGNLLITTLGHSDIRADKLGLELQPLTVPGANGLGLKDLSLFGSELRERLRGSTTETINNVELPIIDMLRPANGERFIGVATEQSNDFVFGHTDTCHVADVIAQVVQTKYDVESATTMTLSGASVLSVTEIAEAARKWCFENLSNLAETSQVDLCTTGGTPALALGVTIAVTGFMKRKGIPVHHFSVVKDGSAERQRNNVELDNLTELIKDHLGSEAL